MHNVLDEDDNESRRQLSSELLLKLVASGRSGIDGDESVDSTTAFIPNLQIDAPQSADSCELKVHLSYQSRVGPVQWLR